MIKDRWGIFNIMIFSLSYYNKLLLLQRFNTIKIIVLFILSFKNSKSILNITLHPKILLFQTINGVFIYYRKLKIVC